VRIPRGLKIPRPLRVRVNVVRGGADAVKADNEGGHYMWPVYSEMLFACIYNLPGMPDARTLTLSEIRWLYEGLRPSLKSATRPR
jgi:hypothetical protein